jgi:RNA polymerase sigma factor for flagellar operon FliA
MSNGRDIEVIWSEFIDMRSAALRDELIVNYSPLVKYVAGRVAVGLPANVEQADLVSYGVFGLINAIERFEPERGFKFETYAIPRIKGAILDELRSMDWVPRSVRAKARSVEKAISKLEAENGRAPSDEEVAGELEIGVDDLHSVLTDISHAGITALDELLGRGERGDSQTLGDTLADAGAGPGGEYEIQEMRQIIAGSINRMAEREKIVLTLYYYEGLTLAEIGKVLGVTESRVCQIHTKAVLNLRTKIQAAERST